MRANQRAASEELLGAARMTLHEIDRAAM